MLDGNRTFTTQVDIDRQSEDRVIFEAIILQRLIRPERGSTFRYIPDVCIGNSSLTSYDKAVFKDLIRGTQTAPLIAYHSVMRFAFPLISGLYAHMECVGFNLIKNGEVSNPRIKHSEIESLPPFNVDSRYVLTIAWPKRESAPFLDKLINKSPYPEGTIVHGRISWEDFVNHPLFSEKMRNLRLEIENEHSEEHPALKMGSAFTNKKIEEFVRPA